MQCPNCGHEARNSTRFCGRCGQQFPQYTPPPPPPAGEFGPPPAASTPVGASPTPAPQPWGNPAPAPAPAPSAPPPPAYPPPSPYAAPVNPYAPPQAPPGYGYPPGPGYMAPRNNGLAVASLILGLVGWVPCGVGSILAIIFGAIARGQIRASAGRETGDGMALAGIILGCVGVALVIGFFVISAVAGSNSST